MQAEQAQGQPAIGSQAAEGGSDVLRAGQAQQADGEVAQGGHDPRAGLSADLLAIFVIRHVPHIVGAVLDGPVPAVEVKQPCRRGLLWRQAGDAVDDFDSALAACEVEPFTGQPEDLAAVGEIEMGVEGAGNLDRSGFQAAMRLLALGVRRGKNHRC